MGKYKRKEQIETKTLVDVLREDYSILERLTPRLNHYIPHIPTPKQSAFLCLTCRDAFFGGAASGGKGSLLSSKVVTPWGYKQMGDLEIGSLISNPDGTTAKVLQVHDRGVLQTYRVYFADGTSYVCDGDHLWLVRYSGKRLVADRKYVWTEGEELVEGRIADTRTLLRYFQEADTRKLPYAPLIPMTKPVQFTMPERNLPIPCYTLGVLLGDGCITKRENFSVTSADETIIQRIESEGYKMRPVDFKGKAWMYKFHKDDARTLESHLTKLHLLGTKSHTKFIPKPYKYASIECRLALIQGLMDTDGYIETGKTSGCVYTTVSKQLADDVVEMIQSLGGRAHIRSFTGKYRNDAGEIIECRQAWEIYIQTGHNEDLFYLPRKKERCRTFHGGCSTVQRRMIGIEPVGKEEIRCITVDHPNGLYLGNDYIVTHNSDALLMAALQYVDIPGYNAVLFRDTFQNLIKPSGLISRAHEWLQNTDARWNGDEKKYTFPSGATLNFSYLDGPLDHFNHQSAEYQFVGIDEMVQIRENQALYLFSRLRRLKTMQHVPIRFRGASNPPAKEQIATGAWVKRRYIDPDNRYDSQTKEYRVFIPARIVDNPYVDAEDYIKSLYNLDPVTRKQLMDGDWEVKMTGHLFNPDWFEIITVKELPEFVKIVRGWDFAGSENVDSKYTSGFKMGVTNDNIYVILDINRFRGTPGVVENELYYTACRDGKHVIIDLPQDPGQAGKYQIHVLRKRLDGFMVKSSPESGSKIERAGPFSSQAEAGNVKMLKGKWNDDFLEEALLFPDGEFTDQVDSASRCHNSLVQEMSEFARFGQPRSTERFRPDVEASSTIHIDSLDKKRYNSYVPKYVPVRGFMH